MDEITAIYKELKQIQLNYYKPDTIIRVTIIGIEGSIIEVPENEGSDESKRQILIHSEDWKKLLEDYRIRQISNDSRVIAIFGIKVVFD